MENLTSTPIQLDDDYYASRHENPYAGHFVTVFDCDGDEVFRMAGTPSHDSIREALCIYLRGHEHGERWGRLRLQSEMAHALGLDADESICDLYALHADVRRILSFLNLD